ncbi:MAG: glycoside hydrolase family 78 protein, partial [Patescibacteria group bacterium]|nr:glycoside hydrolase family 78 protein [Patescibacteria group bacterium]
ENPRLSWILNSDQRGQRQSAYHILVSSSKENLQTDKGDLWDSGKIDSDQSIHILYSGKELKSRMHCYWKVRIWDKEGKPSDWSDPAFWTMGLLDPADWKAKWIGFDDISAPLLRKTCSLDKPIKDAFIYVCGLGYYELNVNGQKIGDHVLDPAQTDYEQRDFYVTYDVSGNVKQGNNAVGIMLGNGFYNQTVVNDKKYGWGDVVYGKPRLIFQMHTTYMDGTETIIVSDESWKASAGPVLSNNVYGGESYDAGREIPGWDMPDFDDAQWKSVQLVDSPGGKLISQNLPPIKRMKVIKPLNLTNPKPGIYVYDMGQNFAGWAKLKIQAEKGTTIRLRFAETIDKEGMIDPASTGVFATHVVQTDSFTCKGSDLEIWEPRFTYHGFRYVEMTGYPGKPTLENLEGVVVHTAVEKAGYFECSDQMLNRIHQTAVWTEISNLHSVPTDCPARERCGWLGDAHVSGEMTIYNFDMPQFWTKYLGDIETTRRGGIPKDIAPGKRTGGDNPDWGTAIVQLPWYLYLYYGDKRILTEHYNGMSVFLEHLKDLAKDYIISKGYGDWCSPGSVASKETPVALTSTAYFYYDAKVMEQTAKILNKDKDVEIYHLLSQQIKTAFNKHFFHYDSKEYGSQTGDCLALYLGLVPENYNADVARSLVRDVEEKHNRHFSTGIMGSRYLYWALSQYGYGELSRQILNQQTYPSIGHLFSLGATTLWETWGEPEIDKAHGTRSLNHPMQGGFDAWFYQGIGGINPDPDNPGFKHIILQPQIIKGLTYAKAHYNSIFGLIKSEWQIVENALILNVTVPANTSATIYVPAKNADSITENGKPAASSDGIKFLRMENDKTIFKITSGNYSFVIKN